ncbi:MAG: hypothetical protein AAFN76_06810 [Pseudomonadota bacterium]
MLIERAGGLHVMGYLGVANVRFMAVLAILALSGLDVRETIAVMLVEASLRGCADLADRQQNLQAS